MTPHRILNHWLAAIAAIAAWAILTGEPTDLDTIQATADSVADAQSAAQAAATLHPALLATKDQQ